MQFLLQKSFISYLALVDLKITLNKPKANTKGITSFSAFINRQSHSF